MSNRISPLVCINANYHRSESLDKRKQNIQRLIDGRELTYSLCNLPPKAHDDMSMCFCDGDHLPCNFQMVQEKEEHKVQQLAYGTVQPSSLSVEADVASSASPEDWWLSLYRTGSPSVHGRIQCRMVEGEGLQCTAVDVKASAQGRRDWLVDSKALDLQHLRIRRPLSEPSSWIPRGVRFFLRPFDLSPVVS